MEDIYLLSKVAAALSDPIRLRILDILVKGRDPSYSSSPHPDYHDALCPYIDIRPRLANIATSQLSYHLKELRKAELVEEHRLGKQVFYLLNKKTLIHFQECIHERYLLSLRTQEHQTHN
jgi:ArsR family transcriptional regulator